VIEDVLVGGSFPGAGGTPGIFVSQPGSPLLELADNRDYALETDYPANWSARRLGTPDPVADQVVASVTHYGDCTSDTGHISMDKP